MLLEQNSVMSVVRQAVYYNMTLRHVHVTIVVVEKHYYIISIVSIIYECVSVILVIQHAKRVPHVVICDLCDSAIFFHIIL
jgi:hypothetical protein